jgi:hypothetical protein
VKINRKMIKKKGGKYDRAKTRNSLAKDLFVCPTTLTPTSVFD